MLNANIIEVVACSDCLKKYTYKMCRFWKVPRQDFVDLVQEIRAEILGCADKYRPDMGSAIQWCRAIARNKVRQYLDQCTRRQDFFSTYDPEAYDPALLPPSPEARTLRREEGCFLSDAFEHELSEREVDVIISHTVDEMPHAEISEELHISVSNSQQCHKRALEILACCIPNSLRAIMPLDLVGCNDATPQKGASSRTREFVKWSHYAGQVTATIIAFLLFVPAGVAPRMHDAMADEPRVHRAAQNDVMYEHDNPSVHRDTPSVKPEPASLRSVCDVPTAAKVVDKPSKVWQSAPLPRGNHKPPSRDQQFLGR